MGWLFGWSKRKKIALTGGASGAQTDFQTKLSIIFDSDMQPNFDDIRFTQSDGKTLIDAWIESKVDSTSAEVWVEFPTTPANTVEQDYYMYYSNPSASAVWDIDATFVFGDDFPNDNKWEVAHSDDGSHSIVNEKMRLVIQPMDSSEHNIKALTPNFGAGHAIRFRERKEDRTTGWYTFAGMQNYIVYTGAYIDAVALRNLGAAEELRSYNNGSHEDTANPFDCTVWHTAEFTWKSGEVKGYIDDVLKATHTTNIPDESDLRPSLEIRTYSSNNPGVAKWVEWDWVFVRKYAANPPTYAFGSEETLIPVFCRHNPCLTGGMA